MSISDYKARRDLLGMRHYVLADTVKFGLKRVPMCMVQSNVLSVRKRPTLEHWPTCLWCASIAFQS